MLLCISRSQQLLVPGPTGPVSPVEDTGSEGSARVESPAGSKTIKRPFWALNGPIRDRLDRPRTQKLKSGPANVYTPPAPRPLLRLAEVKCIVGHCWQSPWRRAHLHGGMWARRRGQTGSGLWYRHRRVGSSRSRWLFPREHGDFAGLGQPPHDLGFVVGIVDPGLPEFSGVAVLLPVVVPVPTAVRPKAKDVDLEDSRGPVRNRYQEPVPGTSTRNQYQEPVPGPRLTSSQTCRAKNSTSMPVDG